MEVAHVIQTAIICGTLAWGMWLLHNIEGKV
jgi:hypothetical protein